MSSTRDAHRAFGQELRASPGLALLLLLVPAIALGLSAWGLAEPSVALNLSLFLCALAFAAFLVQTWNDELGRWATIMALMAAVFSFHRWLRIPGILILLMVPTALAAAFLGFSAALISALGQSILLFLAWLLRIMPRTDALVAIASLWIMVATLYFIYRPIHDLAEWSWTHYGQARDLLEEARNRQSQLKDTLDALAHTNRQFALANERLAAARLAAEDARKAKAAFVAKVSHEFRTPLNMIIGLTDLLLETPEVYGEGLPPRLLQDLDIVRRNCEHLASMISDVLDLSQVEAGRMALHRDWVDLGEILHAAVTTVQPLLQKKGLQLRIDIDDGVTEVYCDRTRIRQVVLNLVSNAARFTEYGSVNIRAEQDAQYVRVSVEDTGPGIAAEDVGRIFEPFEQVNIRPWQSRSGSGLGLSISKQFVELHGGRMWLKSAVGKGSTFYFRLPLAPLQGPAAPATRWITEQWEARRTREDISQQPLRPRVVLWDDTHELETLLVRYGEEIEFVYSQGLVDADQKLRQTASSALLINTASPRDLWPRLEGARAIITDVPIFGCSIPPHADPARERGVTGYLLKPVTRAMVSAAVEAVDGTAERVLVVDDDPDALSLVARMLHSHDPHLAVKTTTQSVESLSIMRQWRPDLVILDIIMPEMDGWQVIQAMQREPALRDIPIVVISAQDPRDEPLTSSAVMATIGRGLSLNEVLMYLQQASALLKAVRLPAQERQ